MEYESRARRSESTAVRETRNRRAEIGSTARNEADRVAATSEARVREERVMECRRLDAFKPPSSR
ncbi:hypothetical protein [Burkholderia mallei]|uniref:hypothetical protein n=1 Tax=Burkholderia mallei TaxID=13373 RepID=UPI0003259DD4|nr:hypothetical protein [Burkholderia mallei]